MSTLLLVILILLLVGGIPAWGFNRDWGWGPSGALGTILMLILILMLLNLIPRAW